MILAAPHHPGVSCPTEWQPWGDSRHPHLLAQLHTGSRGGVHGFGGRTPPSVPISVCPRRGGARLSYQAQVCPAIVLGLGTGDVGTRLWRWGHLFACTQLGRQTHSPAVA